MQVSHVQDHITHAVIGGSQAIEFGISNSAEFFNILSSTLYKDQILAVVRETLCNAWDAHIEAGVTHIPFEVTLDSEKIVIRDFGKGIHKDDMGLIYGTYGNSTKKNDGQQTGGFGLGCKSPFAYTDHFEVQSNHDGVRTIYNLSKSSAAAMGKPGIVPIASFPTTETGLQVTINIKNTADFHRFRTLVKRIARNGEMNINFNRVLVEPLGFDLNKANYLITNDHHILEPSTKVMVRYGNVIYPVDDAQAIAVKYNDVVSHLNRLPTGQPSIEYRIIFQAPPHSISVTPSRESLSMQEHTINTLNKLMKDFMDKIDKEFEPACNEYAIKVIDASVAACNVKALLSRKKALPPNIESGANVLLNTFSDIPTQAHRYMLGSYPGTNSFRKKDITHRLKTMVTAGLLDRGLVQTYLRDLESGAHRNTAWLQKRVIAPLLVKLVAAGLDFTRLYAYDDEDQNSPEKYYRGAAVPSLVPVDNVSPASLYHVLPYLRNIVVIGTSRMNILQRAILSPVFKELGAYHGFFFYNVSMKKNDKIAAVEFFTKLGMEVVDLTVRQEWEPQERYVTSAPAPRKPVKKGSVSLAAMIDPDLGSVNITRYKIDDIARIDKPEFVTLVALRQDVSSRCLDRNWGSEESKYLIELFGDKGAIVTNSAQRDKLIKEGVKDHDEYFREKIINEMLTNTRIHAYWAFDCDRVIEEAKVDVGYHKKLIKIIYRNQALCTEYSLQNTLTADEKKYVYLWKNMVERFTSRYPYSWPDEMVPVKNLLKQVPLDPKNQILVNKIVKNPLVDILDINHLEQLMQERGTKAAVVSANAVKALITIINM